MRDYKESEREYKEYRCGAFITALLANSERDYDDNYAMADNLDVFLEKCSDELFHKFLGLTPIDIIIMASWLDGVCVDPYDTIELCENLTAHLTNDRQAIERANEKTRQNKEETRN